LIVDELSGCPGGHKPRGEASFNLYTRQCNEVVVVINKGDEATVCEKFGDLGEWVDMNPPHNN